MSKYMTKEEVRLCALEDALNEVRKEYDKALDDVLNDKGKGVFGNKYAKREYELRRKLEALEREYKTAKGLRGAYSDDEIEELADSFIHGDIPKRQKLSEGEEAFLDRLADEF